MTIRARELHRALDRQFAEACARVGSDIPQLAESDGGEIGKFCRSEPDLARPRLFRRKDLVMSDATLIRAAKLWRKRSGTSGKDYFVGRMGGCRVLVMENDRHDGTDTDEPTHYLLLGAVDDTPRQGKGGGRG